MATAIDDTTFEPLFPEETEDVVRARWQAWANEGLTPEDASEWTDVRQGSFFDINTGPGIRESARTYDLMGTEYPAAAIPSRSWGTYLDDLAHSYGTERNAATAADGEVTFYGEVGTFVDPGVIVSAEAVDDQTELQEYETTESGTIAAALGAPANLTAADAVGGTLAASTLYRYVVTAVDDEGETIASAEAHDSTTGVNKTIDLNWDDLTGATGYRVYRKTGAAGPPYELLAEVAVSSYSDDGGDSPQAGVGAPTVDTSGDQVTLAVQATSTGSATNAAAGQVNILDTDVTGVDSVSNLEPISGGTDPESDENLSAKVTRQFTPVGPGASADYERWALQYDGVGRVVVVPEWDGPGTVLLILLTEDGDPVSTGTVDAVKYGLDPIDGQAHGQAPIGATVTVTTATAVPVDFSATIEPEPGFSLDGTAGELAIRDDLEAAIADYFNAVQSGSEVVLAKAAARVASHPGVHDIGDVELDGGTVNVTLGADPAEIAVVGTITLTEGAV